MKFRKILLLLGLFLMLTNFSKQNDFDEEELDEEDEEEHWPDEEELEDHTIHEENEVNPARQTVDVDVPMPNHEIKNSFVVNLGAGEIMDIQAIVPTIEVPSDGHNQPQAHDSAHEKKLKKVKKKKKQKMVKKMLM